MHFTKSAAFFFISAACALPFRTTKPNFPTITLPNNDTITGLTQKGVESFRGIPFAAPPIGDLRFKHPVAYDGSLDGFMAQNYGPSCISFSPFHAFDYLGAIGSRLPGFPATPLDATRIGVMDEDCLTINVWRPEGTKEGDDLPVIVWIYGGAFQFGVPPIYPGDPYIKKSVDMDQPVIFVNIPHRMGPWGFLGGNAIQDEGSGNVGLADQRFALEWVADNIHSFGGDPSKVTLMGESSGAMSIGYQFFFNDGDNTYNDKPLFRAAIFQSGAALPVTETNGPSPEAFFRLLSTGVGCDATFEDNEMLECLREQPADSIRAFIDAYSSDLPGFFNLLTQFTVFSPKVDGNMVTENPFNSIREGKFAKIPYITGSQEDEGTIFSLTVLREGASREETDNAIKQVFVNGDSDEFATFLSLYSDDPAEGSPFRTGDRWAYQNQTKRAGALMTDILFTAPRRLLLQSTPKDVSKWVYFADPLHGISPIGSFHANDVFWQFYGRGTPTDAYRNYFIAFANNLNPNEGSGLEFWPQYESDSLKTLHIGLNVLEVAVDVYPQEGREEAIQLAVDTDILDF